MFLKILEFSLIMQTLSFSTHIESTILKCNKMCGIVKRTVGFNAPVNVKSFLFMSLCRSHLDFTSPVWSPHLKSKVKQIESVQRSMTRFILNNADLSYIERCQFLEIQPVLFRRETTDL
ncbi:hypothetical protein CAPTEDRAFT_145511 [Capitella teleta]|uniref:Uncharacterized protein n=1 Tax=Capitella teleta TaxID=283909 RepID=R7UHG8_CAPTE|nr:hypothetical protein CAPTEDRAFT_145511 [Capitella teleta]|eukprot:ELU05640.1 hypothetical protein CAPTEDRAFT_145511 [Capitella teleta]